MPLPSSYDSTKTVAKQIAEKNKYLLVGQFKGSSANVISLGAYNVPQGSVMVTAGGVTLTEGTDYSVDYNAGEVTILNQSIIDAGTPVNVSLESNTDYGHDAKDDVWTELGVRLLEEFPTERYVPASLRTAAYHQGGYGSGTAEQYPLGHQHQLEEGESVAHQYARQDTVPAPYATIADILYW